MLISFRTGLCSTWALRLSKKSLQWHSEPKKYIYSCSERDLSCPYLPSLRDSSLLLRCLSSLPSSRPLSQARNNNRRAREWNIRKQTRNRHQLGWGKMLNPDARPGRKRRKKHLKKKNCKPQKPQCKKCGVTTHTYTKKKETAILTGCLPHLISWRTISKKIRVVFFSNFTYAVFNVLPLKHLYITYIESVICKILQKNSRSNNPNC